jgi:ATP-dependent DNA ligase
VERAADESVRLCAFDLLELDGEDFRDRPLQERKRRLAQLLRKDRDGLEYVTQAAESGF